MSAFTDCSYAEALIYRLKFELIRCPSTGGICLLASSMNRDFTRTTSTEPSRNLLLIAYHFGEGAETGAFRWNAMACDLVNRGWSVDVVTLERDGQRKVQIKPGMMTTSVRLPSWPARILRCLVNAKRQLSSTRETLHPLSIGDATVGATWVAPIPVNSRRSLAENVEAFLRLTALFFWSRRAAAVATAIGRRKRVSAIIVSSPPHLCQMAGVWGARQLRVPLIADFRDPWIFGDEQSTWDGPDRWIGKRLEPVVFQQATTIVCNTEHAAEAVQRTDSAHAHKVVAIPNGFDEEDAIAERPDASFFRVVWAGTFYQFMDVPALLAACGRFLARHPSISKQFRVSFMGCEPDFANVPLKDIAKMHGLNDVFELLPKGGRDEAKRLQESGAVLACFDYPSKMAVAVKFYDYTRMYGSILPIGVGGSALGRAAGRVGIRMIDPSDDFAFDLAFEDAFRRWEAGSFEKIWDSDGYFARSRQSTKLCDLLSRISC